MIDYDEITSPFNPEKPITLDDRKHYLRICIMVTYYNSRGRLSGFTNAATKAAQAINRRDDEGLKKVRIELDEADARIMDSFLHGEGLPK